MPFRLVYAPVTFQWLMELALSGLAHPNCLVYYDVLVVGSTFEEHNSNLEEVRKRICQAGLCL